MLSWGLAGASAGFLRPFLRHRLLLIAFGTLWGFLFGAIMDIYQLASFGPVFTWQAFVATHARGIPFDITHAVTNAVLLAVAGPGLIRLLRRHGRRLHVELVPDPTPP
jgi:energy-coupling factor transport system substrate-specific component